ncbi:GreA/GreB family elongation factor [Flavimarina sp. Hel_I_48]|uniref:GreA/GreB family elongation factor n=1 Tax=Flavimarina sp. Hel_I_48 TaxID=1392488 RepID=UPI00068D95D4|nr:GreA/GreB family elongation factor [Flavimarina sp. Hel_I_48]
MAETILSRKKVIVHLNQLLEKKMQGAIDQIASLKESRESDGKSSAGDKYETGVEMIQQEIENAQRQLDQYKRQQTELQRAQAQNSSEVISFGNLVTTTKGSYFLAIGIGEIKLDDTKCYCISTESPLGAAFLGKKAKDKVVFNNNEHTILDIA